MFKCRPNSLFFLWRALWHLGIIIPRQIIVLSYIQSTFLLNLCNIQRRNRQPRLLLHIILYLLISRPFPEIGHIHILQRELYPHFLGVDFSLGKQNNRLNVPRACNKDAQPMTYSLSLVWLWFDLWSALCYDTHRYLQLYHSFNFSDRFSERKTGRIKPPNLL